MPVILILIGLPLLISLIEFFGFILKGKRVVNTILFRIIEIAAFIVLPYLYASIDPKNDCCGDSAAFSPDHQLTILVFVVMCLGAYFYSSYRKKLSTPVIEIILNCLLVFGIVFNIVIALQTNQLSLALGGNLPIILLTILVLVKNQRLFLEQHQDFQPKNKFETIIWNVLKMKPILKYPIIFLLCLPIIILVTSLLLLLGQKPDSLIRAFTDTYKHGFSQWDYQCDNVECGGHYLCSVAAKGHHKIVKPQRFGERNGGRIICNRQLLISNAFEELIQERVPFVHRLIRKQYNKVGTVIHKYYNLFDIKIVADFIYVLMKPLEWIFLWTLYTFDRKPENRIAKQYLSSSDRQALEKL